MYHISCKTIFTMCFWMSVENQHGADNLILSVYGDLKLMVGLLLKWHEICRKWVSVKHWTIIIIIHQTHYEKSDWSRAFNQSTIAYELDMINVISAADTVLHLSWQVQHLPGY